MEAASAMPCQVRPDVNRICDQQGNDERKQEPFWKPLLQIRGQALSRHLADACAHHLHGGHQRPRKQCGPEKFGSELRACNGVCSDARRIVVSSPGNDSGPKRLQQRSNPTRWGGCRQMKVGTCISQDRSVNRNGFVTTPAREWSIWRSPKLDMVVSVVNCYDCLAEDKTV